MSTGGVGGGAVRIRQVDQPLAYTAETDYGDSIDGDAMHGGINESEVASRGIIELPFWVS